MDHPVAPDKRLSYPLLAGHRAVALPAAPEATIHVTLAQNRDFQDATSTNFSNNAGRIEGKAKLSPQFLTQLLLNK